MISAIDLNQAAMDRCDLEFVVGSELLAPAGEKIINPYVVSPEGRKEALARGRKPPSGKANPATAAGRAQTRR